MRRRARAKQKTKAMNPKDETSLKTNQAKPEAFRMTMLRPTSQPRLVSKTALLSRQEFHKNLSSSAKSFHLLLRSWKIPQTTKKMVFSLSHTVIKPPPTRAYKEKTTTWILTKTISTIVPRCLATMTTLPV